MTRQQDYKRQVGERAAELVEPGMRVGLGSGTTAMEFVRALGARVASGLQITAVPSSERTAALAEELGIELVEPGGGVDLAIDGADAVERRSLTAIKGLGGALVREKLVALTARRFVLIVDESKVVDQLSETQPRLPVPIEIESFGWQWTQAALATLGRPVLREDASGQPVISDNGNLTLDLFDADYAGVEQLSQQIKLISGVVDHGLFVGLASGVISAGADGIEEIWLTQG